jgi:hypothetical protein
LLLLRSSKSNRPDHCAGKGEDRKGGRRRVREQASGLAAPRMRSMSASRWVLVRSRVARGYYSSSGRAAGFFASCGSVLAPGRSVSGLLRSSARFLASCCGVPERGGVFTHLGTTASTLLLLEQPASRVPKNRSATRRDIYLPAQGSILPEVPKPVGRQLRIAHRVLDIFVSKKCCSDLVSTP